jgi:hypothetical protein
MGTLFSSTNVGEKISFGGTGSKYNGDKSHPGYNQTFSGNSLNLILQKNHALPTDIDTDNIIARGASFDWSENYNILPVIEYNTYFIQEQVVGLHELGKGTLATFEVLRIGDSLPNAKTLPYDSEITMLEVVGDDHPAKGTVLNVFYGVRITGQSGGFNPNALASRHVNLSYRYRLPGKEYKALVNDAKYPGDVQGDVQLTQ